VGVSSYRTAGYAPFNGQLSSRPLKQSRSFPLTSGILRVKIRHSMADRHVDDGHMENSEIRRRALTYLNKRPSFSFWTPSGKRAITSESRDHFLLMRTKDGQYLSLRTADQEGSVPKAHITE
jgi:hypothetical protein